jgi:hypothetical protein
MKNKKNDFFLWITKFVFYTSASLMITMIGLFVYAFFAPYIHDKLLTDRSIAIICKLKKYQQTHQKLPDSLNQIMDGTSWWEELHYIRENDRDFTLSISNGFDSVAIYKSTNNKWDGPDHPFIFKQEAVEVDCPPIHK